MAVELRLLGPPHVRDGGTWLHLAIEKRVVLLAYLACQEGWVERDRLAFLFWPDVEESRARGNLRQLLRRARSLPFARGVQSGADAVRWEVASDVGAFRQALGSGAWSEAVDVYRGDLLGGGGIDDGSAIAEWLELERDTLQRQWREACLERSEELSRAADHAQAARLLQRVLDQDVLAEDVVQAFLRSALASGQREQGLRLFGTFRDRLMAELALEPLPATVELAAALRVAPTSPAAPDAGGDALAPMRALSAAATVGVLAEAAALRPQPGVEVAARPASSLPDPASPLIGRDLELAELAGVFADPERRLVTLVGPGGTGKTRLALEVAWERVEAFEHGCHFVPLAPLEDAALIPAAIADRLGVPLTGQGDTGELVLAYLRDKRLLLVIDNLEHVLEGAGFLVEMLEAAPELRLVVTSREPLGVANEAVFDLAGLGYPDDVDATSPYALEAYDAVRLFIRRARRQVPSFAVSDGDRAPLLALCQLLQGNPLGLELAAVWVRSLRVGEIVEALQGDIDALPVAEAEVAERHRSLRAVFDHSWSLLSDEEREAMASFSVFRGGATKAAALEVTGASLRALLALVNKSLLTRDSAGRFEVLEPLRQYAEGVLRSRRGARRRAQDRHAACFAAFLAERAQHLRAGPEQRPAFAQVDQDLDNVRAAWGHACRTRDAERVHAMVDALGLYLERRNAFAEGRALLAQASHAFVATPHLRVRLDVWAAAFHGSSGAFDEAERLLAQALEATEAMPPDAVPPDTVLRWQALLRWAVVRRHRGDYPDATAKARAALAGFEAVGDVWSAANAHNLLGTLALVGGDMHVALTHFGACAEARRQIGDAWGASIPLLNLGTAYRYLGDVDAAERHYLESLAIARENGNLVGVSFVLGTLAAVDVFRGALAQAEARYLESLAIRRRLGDRWLIANTLVNLVPVRGRLGAFDDAHSLLEEARALFDHLGDEQGLATVQGAEAGLLFEQRRYPAAERAYRRALDMEHALGHAHGVMTAKEGLARVAFAMGDVDAARSLACDVLAAAREAGYAPNVLAAVTIVAECAAASGDAAGAVRISRAVTAHAATDHALARRAALVIEGLAEPSEPSVQGSTPTLDAIVDEVLGGGHG